MSCVLLKSFSPFFLSCPHPSPKTLPVRPILSALAPLVNGAAVYRRRPAWLGISGAFGWRQRPRRTGCGAHRWLGPCRFRGEYGGSTRIWGTLGTRTSPAPAQPQEIQVQRQQQAGPLACCWRVSDRAAQLLPPLSSHICLIYIFNASQNCTAVSYQPFCQPWSSRLASLLVVRWHVSITGFLVFSQIKSCFSPSFLTSPGQGCCTQTQGITHGDKEG